VYFKCILIRRTAHRQLGELIQRKPGRNGGVTSHIDRPLLVGWRMVRKARRP